MNNNCVGRSCRPRFGKLWISVEANAMAAASNSPSCTIASNTKGRFIDILPVRPGSLTFRRDVRTPSSSKLANWNWCSGWMLNAPLTMTVIAAMAMRLMNIVAVSDLFFIE